MTGAPAASRPPLFAWGALWVLALAAVYELYPARLEGHWELVTPLLLLAGLMAARKLWEFPPAVTMCAAIALRIFSNAWEQVGFGGIPIDRLLLVFVLLQIFLRSPGAVRMPSLRLGNVHLLLGLTVLYLLASAAAAGTLGGESGGLPILDEFGVTPFLAFLIAPSVFAGRRERNLLLAVLVGLGLYLGLTAIFESIGPHRLVFPRYIVAIDAVDPAERVNGPFQSSVAEGCALFACAVAAAIAFAAWRGSAGDGSRPSPARPASSAASRRSSAAFGSPPWSESWPCPCSRRRGGAGCFRACSPLRSRSAAPWRPHPLSPKRPRPGRATNAACGSQEPDLAGLRMLAAKPLFGFGLGRYKTDSLEYFRQPADYPMTGRVALDVVGDPEVVQPLHNLYLDYAVELGLVGLSLWLASLLWAVGGAIFVRGPAELRPWKLGLLAISVFLLVATAVNPNQPPFTALLLWTWAGVATANVFGEAPRRSSHDVRQGTVATWPARLGSASGT